MLLIWFVCLTTNQSHQWVSNLGEPLLIPLREAIQQYSIRAYWEQLKIVPAQLGDNAGLIGAAALVTAGLL